MLFLFCNIVVRMYTLALSSKQNVPCHSQNGRTHMQVQL